MTKKKVIIIVIILLALLAVFSVIFANTEEFSAKALSLFVIMVTGYGIIVLALYSLGRINTTFSEKRRISFRKRLFNGLIIIAILFFIMHTVGIVTEKHEFTTKYVLGMVLNIGMATMWLIMGISGRMQVRKELSGLSEKEDSEDAVMDKVD